MSNPNNAVGTNAAYSGRTSVNAFNDDLAAFTAGVLSGWACESDTGLTLALGGDANIRDVAIAADNAGNKTSINNISGSPISVTISTPPVSNSRIDAIVAYVDNPPQGVSTTADNPAACGLITVEGTAAVTPVAPNDGAIRTAITADGASGSTAYYVVLALVTVASGTTDITSDAIAPGDIAQISGDIIDFSTFNGSQTIPFKNWYVAAGVAGSLNMYRMGNICIATGSNVTSSWPDGNRVTTNKSVPAGLTPLFEAEIICNFLDGAGAPSMASFTVKTDGEILRSRPAPAITQSSRYDYIGVWVTHDPWPAS